MDVGAAVEVELSARHRGPAASVTLVRPAILVPRLSITAPTCPPVGVAYLAAAVRRAGHNVQVVDAVGEAPDQFMSGPDPRFLVHGLTADEIAGRLDPACDVVGISCMFSHEWPVDRAVIGAVRQRCPEALIVVGGEHPTALPNLVLEDCPAVDVVVTGEGEMAFVEVISSRHDRALIAALPTTVMRGAQSPAAAARRTQRIHDVDSIAPPAWDLVPIETYLDRQMGFGVCRGRSMPVVASRGCPYQCTFCSSPSMWTTRWTARDPNELLDEIEGYLKHYHADNIDFYDLTAVVRRSWIVEFCELVLERKLSFTWQLPSGTRSEAIDAEVAGLMRRSGCRNVSYAPESGSPALLERIKKRVDLGRMKGSMRAAVKEGINCKANIILGLPGETHRDVLRTLQFTVETAVLGLHDISFTPFSPYPGSELFDQLKAEGRIGHLDDDYYFSLASYSDLTTTVSWSEHESDRALARYCALGMGLFYAVSFACRPWRVAQLLREVAWTDTQESRLGMSIRDHLHRRRSAKDRWPSIA